jgi:hypothetical protein
VGVPGVSDLDVVLVCDDAAYATVTKAAAYLAQATPEARYLFHHEMLVLPASCTPRLPAVHAVENLRTLWGDAAWLPAGESDGDRALLRQVLWGTSALNNILHICGVRGASLRHMLIRLAVIAKTTSRNQMLMGDAEAARRTVRVADEQRRAVLAAGDSAAASLLGAALGRALEDMMRSEWALDHRLRSRGVVASRAADRRVWLSHHHVAVFADAPPPDGWHRWRGGVHETTLPSTMGTLASVIIGPWLRQRPDLAPAWQDMGALHGSLASALPEWLADVRAVLDGYVRVGAEPVRVLPSPFRVQWQVTRAKARLMRAARVAVPGPLRRWLRAAAG